MSKNKNPLKDLDLFLKQQAASFVNPTPLSDRLAPADNTPTGPESSGDLISRLTELAQHDREKFLDLIIQAAEKDPSGNTMLINTALYLKSGANWKEAVRQYWQNK